MKFRVWCDEYHDGPEDGRIVEASDAEYAATEWAEDQDSRSADYTIASGNDVIVHVRPEDGGECASFHVSGYAVPEYRAHPVKKEQ